MENEAKPTFSAVFHFFQYKEAAVGNEAVLAVRARYGH